MKIAFWQIGKTKENYLKSGEEQYENRLKHYLSFESKVFPDIKNAGKLKPIDLKKAEAKMILGQIQNSDLLISVGCRIDNIITAFNQKKKS